jgi:uncharacterized protein (TIGR00251 family)
VSQEPIAARGNGVRLAVTVIPRSPKPGISGLRNGRLLVRVAAPPVDSAANEEVRTRLAATLRVPRGAVTLVSGHLTRHKVIDVDGVDVAAVQSRLGE